MDKKVPQVHDYMRKIPTQLRGERTLETIFEATAQILNAEGEAGLTTNKVAEKAGFSIGTLYEYFPTKEAIVLTMFGRERAKIMRQLEIMLLEAEQRGTPPEDLMRQFIRLLIKAFGTGDKLKRNVIQMAWRLNNTPPVVRALNEMAAFVGASIDRLNHPSLRRPTETTLFIVTRSVMGTIRSASTENSPLLGTQEFEDELVRMAWSVVKA